MYTCVKSRFHMKYRILGKKLDIHVCMLTCELIISNHIPPANRVYVRNGTTDSPARRGKVLRQDGQSQVSCLTAGKAVACLLVSVLKNSLSPWRVDIVCTLLDTAAETLCPGGDTSCALWDLKLPLRTPNRLCVDSHSRRRSARGLLGCP